MDVIAGSSPAWSRLVGRPVVRHFVNLGFHLEARLRTAALARADAVRTQERTLRGLVRRARGTRFGRDHRFDRIREVSDFQQAVPIRTYEALWEAYLRDH